MTTVQPPIDLEKWIEENADKFKPPVSNRYLYDGRDFFVMVIKGPNARNDFHLVDSEEYFYQLKGNIKVRVREGDRIVDHVVREGETFFIPANVPHSPQRPPETVGVVVERRRPIARSIFNTALSNCRGIKAVSSSIAQLINHGCRVISIGSVS